MNALVRAKTAQTTNRQNSLYIGVHFKWSIFHVSDTAFLAFLVPDTSADDISRVFQFLYRCGDTVYTVTADLRKTFEGIVPFIRQGQHEGQKPLCL